MSQINVNYIIDVTVLLALLIFAVRVILVRLKRATYLRSHKYERGTREYSNILRITSTPVLMIASILSISSTVRVGVDVYDIVNSSERSKYYFLLFGAAGVILFYGVIAFVVLNALGISVNPRHSRDRDKNEGQ